MHELPITKGIHRAVMRHAESAGAERVTRVVLEVGILRDFVPEIVQKYWDYIARGTAGEGARVEIRELSAAVSCGGCGRTYRLTRDNAGSPHCPRCGHPYGTLLSGDELRIAGIEIVREHKDNVTT